MYDAHCHVDLYPDPLMIAIECESLGINTIAMTNLPSHFIVSSPNLISFTKIRLALGMHPLYAIRHDSEFPLFLENLDKTSYIGEVGLDFSEGGISTRTIQEISFKNILSAIANKKKILSLHSRKAEKEVLQYLIEYNIKTAIFHWYTGPVKLIEEIVEAGYYFSINPAMIRSKSGQQVINKIPSSRILTESDGPYIQCKGRIIQPSDIELVHSFLAKKEHCSLNEINEILNANLNKLLTFLKK